MQRAAQAYGAVAKQTANPRELEADLLLTAAARLQAIHDGWDAKFPELDAALVYNRKLWSIFVTSATSTENPLPAGIRQNVANLGLFVFNHTLAIMADPRPESLGSLACSSCQRSCWRRIRLPAGSRRAQSRTPYGWSIGSWTISAPLACSRSKVPSRSLVARRRVA